MWCDKNAKKCTRRIIQKKRYKRKFEIFYFLDFIDDDDDGNRNGEDLK